MYTTISPKGKKRDRKAAVLVLAAILMVLIFAVLAFAVDLGFISLAQTQLQNAADSAALAGVAYAPSYVYTPDDKGDTVEIVAKRFAKGQSVAGKDITDQSVTVDYGTWNTTSRAFAAGAPGNAIRVTVQRDAGHDSQVPLFFASVLGKKRFDGKASAIAMTNPRDICFVVDLSGSMNDDTEPCWATHEIGGPIGDTLMQQVYTDFGFGTFPGTTQHVGQPLGIAQNNNAFSTLSGTSSPLKNLSDTFYKITSSDNTAAKRRIKAYRWMTDYQLAVIMPNALPTPNAHDTASYNFWKAYLDYVIYSQPSGASISPLTSYGNPQTNSYPDATTAEIQSYRNKLGYKTYVQFMMDHGRDSVPTGAGQYTQLSSLSSYFVKKPDTIPDVGTFLFPPREMPTHAARRSIIAALQIVKERNANIGDSNQCDWVSIITFDKNTNANTITPLHDLDYDYDGAMQDCTTLQAVSDINASTSTSTGLLAAKNLLSSSKARQYTDKVIVLLTDGLPNLKDINSGSPPSPLPPGWPSDTNERAAMTQIYNMQSDKWHIFPVGIGLGCNYTFMDCAAVTGGTADPDGKSPRGSGDPSQYEETLKIIFKNIINNPKGRLVK